MIGAIIGAAATLGGALLSSKSSKKAATQAADAQVKAAELNNQLAREFRTSNTANFQPTMASGLRANSLLDSFLYGPQAAPQQQAPAAANDPNMGGIDPQQFVPDYSVGMGAINGLGARNLALARSRATMPGVMNPAQMPAQQPVAQPTAAAPANALSGYDQFTASPYYQTPLQEGIRARNMGYAARGIHQSGAAQKELDRFGQNYAAGRMDEYLGLAERQANRGVTGASAIAGVGQNALSAMTGNNQMSADALSNAALLRGQANNSLYGSLAGAIGGLASSFKW